MKPANHIKAEQIIYDVCCHFKINPADLITPCKPVAAFVLPRQIAMYLLCIEAGYGYKQADKAINGASYYSCCKIQERIREGDETVIRFLVKYRYCKRQMERIRRAA